MSLQVSDHWWSSVADPYLAVRVAVTKFVSEEPQPGIAEAELIDAHAKQWVFVEKQVYFAAGSLWSDTVYPQPGTMMCQVLATWTESGRTLARIDTNRLREFRAVNGRQHIFEVLTSQLCWIEKSTGKELRPFG